MIVAFFTFLPFVELGRRVVDVVGLPGQRRKAHVHARRLDAVDAAALVVLALQAERVEHLHFVAALQIAAAVAAPLSARRRHERQQKLDVQLAVAELVAAGGAGGEQALGVILPGSNFAALVPSNSTMAPCGGFAPRVGLLRSIFFKLGQVARYRPRSLASGRP